MNKDMLKKIKYLFEQEKLNTEQLCWIKYADKLGLDIDWLDENIINIKSNKIYTIKGLCWHYEKFKMIDADEFDNELIIHIKYLKTNTVKSVNMEKSTHTNKFMPNSLYSTYISNDNIFTELFDDSPVLSSDNIINKNYFNSINEKLDDICKHLTSSKIENTKVLNKPEEYINLESFIKNFKFVNETFQMPATLIKPKFKIIIE